MATPLFFTLSRERQRTTLEALIFASDEPMTMKTLYKILVLEEGTTDDPQPALPLNGTHSVNGAAKPDGEHSSPDSDEMNGLPQRRNLPDGKALAKLVEELTESINDELFATGRPYRIVRIAGGYQFATVAEYGEYVARLVKSKTKRRLSQAALEVLAIIAYKQPVTKPEIESIRGINSNEVINALVEKELVTITGRSEAVGKPLLYGTTDEFLRTFGLHSLDDLPRLRELDDLFQNKARELASEIDISVKTSSDDIIEKVQSMIDNEQSLAEYQPGDIPAEPHSSDEASESLEPAPDDASADT
ncbi:MAG: SMC-Scp complex subunit ScpB [Candidatus Kapabacteria bacterium]|nr:SMC-Scp complex subunit ScpB [Candidatus Kapabacteria bacterium]